MNCSTSDPGNVLGSSMGGTSRDWDEAKSRVRGMTPWNQPTQRRTVRARTVVADFRSVGKLASNTTMPK